MTVDSDKRTRLEELRKALAAGTYEVDPKLVVDAIIVRALKRLPPSSPRA